MYFIFKDHDGERILLSNEVWVDHISQDHPRIDLNLIGETLHRPFKVCLSQHPSMEKCIQYYSMPKMNRARQLRFIRVIVKHCHDGLWISTAHMKAKITCGKILFEKIYEN